MDTEQQVNWLSGDAQHLHVKFGYFSPLTATPEVVGEPPSLRSIAGAVASPPQTGYRASTVAPAAAPGTAEGGVDSRRRRSMVWSPAAGKDAAATRTR